MNEAPDGAAPPATDEVAIIGMACLFPGAPGLQAYWANILGKVDAVTDPPPGWGAAEIYDPDSSASDRIYCRRGGFLGDVARFDPLPYGVMPNAVEGAEPEHFLAMRIAHDALEDAGYLSRPFNREKAGVILGRGTFLNRGNVTALQHGLMVDQTIRVLREFQPDLREEVLAAARQQLRASLPPFNHETAPGLVSNVMCGRIANRLDLRGPNYAVDAACASSMIALDLGIRELQSGRCDLMVVGGVSVSTGPIVFMVFSQLGALSRKARIRPFDAEADGTLLGEGIGMVVLKRRADAERDGDRIYAVVKGAGVASDGRGLAVLAPRVEGEELALRRAYASAGLDPGTIGLIEAHGTGTAVGDATEIEALRRVFGERDGRYPRCAIGSVKSMISHTIPAAGVAGLIKAALALYHRTLPPTLHCDRPNPKLELERTPFYVNTETRPWIHGGRAPRRAGVNAFGFGGINTHVILEEPAGVPGAGAVPWDSEVLIVEGNSRAELVARGETVRRFLGTSPVPLCDLAFTLNLELRGERFRLAIVATSPEDFDRKLGHALGRLSKEECRRIKDVSGIYYFEEPLVRAGTLAFLFPGEGSQYVNMLADLCLRFPEVRACFDRADRVFVENGRDYRPSQVVFPAPLDAGPDDRALWQIDCAIASVFAANEAVARLLASLDLRPAAVVGHSSGEYAALWAGGALEVRDEVELMQHAVALNELHATLEERIPEAMLLTVGAVRTDAIQELVAASDGQLRITMDNCPHQVVLAGTPESVTKAQEALRRKGAICGVLPFRRSYHSPELDAISGELDRYVRCLRLASPRLPIYSCMTAAPFPAAPDEVRRLAVGQWSNPVRFRETVEAMYTAGVRVFVEVGPGGTLSGFVEDVLRGRPFLAVPTNVRHRSGVSQLHHALAMLQAHGASMRLDRLYTGRRVRRLDLTRPEPPPAEPAALMPVRLELPTARLGGGTSIHGLTPRHADALAPRLAAASPGASPRPSPITANGPERARALASGTNGAESLMTLRTAAPLPAGSTGDGDRGAVVIDYLRTMERFLEVQEAVVQAYVAGAAPGSAFSTAPSREPAAAPAPAGSHVPPPRTIEDPGEERSPEGAPPSAPAHSPRAPDGPGTVTTALLAVVSEKTGYPVEMLDLALDMEADLGIDSIKRVEILGAFQRVTGLVRPEEMERVTGFKTLGQIVKHFTASTAVPAPTERSGPAAGLGAFVGEVVSLTADEVVTVKVLDVARDHFLRHHTIGGQPSMADPSLLTIPVVPLTISLEIMTEVAALLCPGKRIVGMRNVRASRWFTVEGARRAIRIAATRRTSAAGDLVETRIVEPDDSAFGGPIVEGIVVFADAPAPPPAVRPLELRAERPFRFAPEEYYTEVMFHGPMFQSVTAMSRCGDDGAEAKVRTGHETGLLQSMSDARVHLDPALLDAAGQVVGFWTTDRLAEKWVVFPMGFDTMHLYGPMPGPDAQVTCRMRVLALRDDRVESEIEFLDGTGRLIARFERWKDLRFDFPREFVRFVLRPRDRTLTEPWPAATDGLRSGRSVECRRLRLDRLPREVFDATTQIWPQAWARLLLNHRERQAWLSVPEGRRPEWLSARLAAKDAARRLLAARHGVALCPADVEIVTDEHGAPQPRVASSLADGPRLAVSLAHAGGVAVAVAAECEADEGVGVDVEPVGPKSDDLVLAAFGSDERSLLAALPPGVAAEWTVRLWCAKEALGKALGRGLLGGPRSVVVRDLDRESGEVRMTATGELARVLGLDPLRGFVVHTARDGDLVVACGRARRGSEA